MGHNPLWCCIQIPIENSLSKHNCIKKIQMRLQKSIWPHCGDLCRVCRNIFVLSLLTLEATLVQFSWKIDKKWLSIFSFSVIRVYRQFSINFCHFTFHIMSVCRFVVAGVQRLSVMVLPLFTTVHRRTRIMVVIVIRTRSCCCNKSLIIKSPCG